MLSHREHNRHIHVDIMCPLRRKQNLALYSVHVDILMEFNQEL